MPQKLDVHLIPRQQRHAQNRVDPALAGQTSALSRALYADFSLLAKLGRMLVRHLNQGSAAELPQQLLPRRFQLLASGLVDFGSLQVEFIHRVNDG